MSCTLFTAHKDGTTLVGYNFDWPGTGGNVWFIPGRGNYGYMVTEQFGRLIPYEGINEKGLFAGQTAVPSVNSRRKFSFKKKISISTNIITWVLGSASSCDEGIDIFKRTLFFFGTFFGFVQLHFMMADRDGNSAVIELVDGEMEILPANSSSHVMTNYYISSPDIAWPEPVPGCGGYDRFETADAMLRKNENVSREGFRKILTETCTRDWLYGGRVFNTLWSSIHDCSTLVSSFYYKMDFSREMTFNLADELKRGRHGYNFEDL